MISAGLKKFIESNAIGFATVGRDGRPHNIAVAYVKVDGDKIIVSNSHIKKSVENLKYNNKVSLVVWNKNWEKVCVGYEIIGEAETFTEGRYFKYVSGLPENNGYKIVSAIVVKIEKIKKLIS